MSPAHFVLLTGIPTLITLEPSREAVAFDMVIEVNTLAIKGTWLCKLPALIDTLLLHVLEAGGDESREGFEGVGGQRVGSELDVSNAAHEGICEVGNVKMLLHCLQPWNESSKIVYQYQK
jgi:hypothetical protein